MSSQIFLPSQPTASMPSESSSPVSIANSLFPVAHFIPGYNEAMYTLISESSSLDIDVNQPFWRLAAVPSNFLLCQSIPLAQMALSQSDDARVGDTEEIYVSHYKSKHDADRETMVNDWEERLPTPIKWSWMLAARCAEIWHSLIFVRGTDLRRKKMGQDDIGLTRLATHGKEGLHIVLPDWSFAKNEPAPEAGPSEMEQEALLWERELWAETLDELQKDQTWRKIFSWLSGSVQSTPSPPPISRKRKRTEAEHSQQATIKAKSGKDKKKGSKTVPGTGLLIGLQYMPLGNAHDEIACESYFQSSYFACQNVSAATKPTHQSDLGQDDIYGVDSDLFVPNGAIAKVLASGISPLQLPFQVGDVPCWDSSITYVENVNEPQALSQLSRANDLTSEPDVREKGEKHRQDRNTGSNTLGTARNSGQGLGDTVRGEMGVAELAYSYGENISDYATSSVQELTQEEVLTSILRHEDYEANQSEDISSPDFNIILPTRPTDLPKNETKIPSDESTDLRVTDEATALLLHLGTAFGLTTTDLLVRPKEASAASNCNDPLESLESLERVENLATDEAVLQTNDEAFWSSFDVGTGNVFDPPSNDGTMPDLEHNPLTSKPPQPLAASTPSESSNHTQSPEQHHKNLLDSLRNLQDVLISSNFTTPGAACTSAEDTPVPPLTTPAAAVYTTTTPSIIETTELASGSFNTTQTRGGSQSHIVLQSATTREEK